MRLSLTITALALALLVSTADAQPPGKKDKGGKSSGSETVTDFVNKVMAFNKAKDGKLTKAELTDPRLHALFTRADTNKDGVLTREELEALFARESVGDTGGKGGPGGDGFKGKGPDGKGGPDGKKGKGPKGGPPQAGQILPPFMQEALGFTDAQRTQLAELQKDVNVRLENILTESQRAQLRDMREKGPGGFGPPGGDKKGPPPFGKK